MLLFQIHQILFSNTAIMIRIVALSVYFFMIFLCIIIITSKRPQYDDEFGERDKQVSRYPRLRIAAIVVLCLIVPLGFGYAVYSAVEKSPQEARFQDSFNPFNKNEWFIPATASYEVPTDVGDSLLKIVKAPEPIYPKGYAYSDFIMTFHLRMNNGRGAAWVIRGKDEENYYLFHLNGPGDPALPQKLYFYVVKGGTRTPVHESDTNNLQNFVFDPKLQYTVCVSVHNGDIQCVIKSNRGHKYKPTYEDPKEFATGYVGFRTVSDEEFSIDEIYIAPGAKVFGVPEAKDEQCDFPYN